MIILASIPFIITIGDDVMIILAEYLFNQNHLRVSHDNSGRVFF